VSSLHVQYSYPLQLVCICRWSEMLADMEDEEERHANWWVVFEMRTVPSGK